MGGCEECGKPLSPRATRYCGHRCSAVARERGKRNGAPLPTKTCERCGQEFQKSNDWTYAHWNRRRFCSRECRGNGRQPAMVLQCETCGCDFVWRKRGNRPPQRFCSSACYGVSLLVSESAPRRYRKREFSQAQRRKIRERANWCCEMCGKRTESLDCDHVIPVSEGGTNTMDNAQALCEPCHAVKTAADVSRFWERRRLTPTPTL